MSWSGSALATRRVRCCLARACASCPFATPLFPAAGALTDTFSLVIGQSDLRSFNQLQPPNLRLSSVERFAAALVLVSQILLISFLVINFFFAILGYT